MNEGPQSIFLHNFFRNQVGQNPNEFWLFHWGIQVKISIKKEQAFGVKILLLRRHFAVYSLAVLVLTSPG
jgi:hypothetical protein